MAKSSKESKGKKAPVKSKLVVSKPAAKKTAAPEKVAAKKPAVKSTKAPAKPTAPVATKTKEAVVKAAPKVASSKEVASAAHLTKTFVEEQKRKLLDLQDHILDQMQCVAQDSLRARPEGSEASAFGMHQADAGSDAYDKDFALSLLSQEQDALYEVEQALKRIEAGQYGICEMSGKSIPKNRLDAIPFARFTVECQAQLERENRGRRRWETTPQFMDSEDSLVDEDDESGDDEERRKEKE